MGRLYKIIKTKLNNVLNNIQNRIILCISLFIFLIFLYVIINASEIHGNLNQLRNMRLYLFYFISSVLFWLLPVDAKTKSKIFAENLKLIGFMILGLFSMYHWLISSQRSDFTFTVMLKDIAGTISLVATISYVLKRFVSILMAIWCGIIKLTRIFFNTAKEQSTGFRFLVEWITTFIISAGTFLGATYALMQAIKSIISIFAK